MDKETDKETNTKCCVVCGKHTNKKCSGCKSVFYCSTEHQRLHWTNEHNKQCRKLQRDETRDSESNSNELRGGNGSLWTPLPSPASCVRDKPVSGDTTRENDTNSGVPVVTTPSTVNQNGEPATLLRPDMAKSYYDGALLAIDRTEYLRLPTNFNAQRNDADENHLCHSNAKQALNDFIKVRRDIIAFSSASAGIKLAQNTLSTGQMMRNGTNAAHSLLRGAAAGQPVSRDPKMSDIFESMEEALPNDVPMAFYCGFADATLEIQMFLRDLSAERNHCDPLIVAAVATCSASYIVAQDRVRARLEKHRLGAQQNPEVLEALNQLEETRKQSSHSK